MKRLRNLFCFLLLHLSVLLKVAAFSQVDACNTVRVLFPIADGRHFSPTKTWQFWLWLRIRLRFDSRLDFGSLLSQPQTTIQIWVPAAQCAMDHGVHWREGWNYATSFQIRKRHVRWIFKSRKWGKGSQLLGFPLIPFKRQVLSQLT